MAYNAVKNLTPMYVRKKFYHQRFGKKKFFPKPNHPLSFSCFVLPGFPGLFRRVPKCSRMLFQVVEHAICISRPVYMGWASPVSQASPLSFYRAGSAHALYPLKNVVVFIWEGKLAPLLRSRLEQPGSRQAGAALLPCPINTATTILRGNKAWGQLAR